jgi:hypothetical protein
MEDDAGDAGHNGRRRGDIAGVRIRAGAAAGRGARRLL